MTPATNREDPPETLVDSGLEHAMSAREPGDAIAPGEIIGRDHRVRDILGSGAMGSVYLAEDLALGRDVAIKIIHESLLDCRGARAAFVDEARAMARVKHANVVTIHAFGEHRGRPYLVMEYVEGTNLAQWQTPGGTHSVAEAMAVLEPLCQGVQAIHDAGALHRDLKPANVLLGLDGRVAVTDFGLSGTSVGGGEGGPLSALGTPAYISPEVARDEAIEPALATRVDVYALGVVAFELLTGVRPFRAGSVVGLLAEHAWAMPQRPSGLRPDLSPTFDAPLLRALDKSPEWRTPSAAALCAELVAAHAAAAPRLRRFLLVDDEPIALLALRELIVLSFPGVEVIAVTNTDTAVQIAGRDPPDVVVCDLQMPGGGAEPLTIALRRNPVTAQIPIIVVTGHGGAEHWRELRALGADRFLVKPLDIDSLAAVIRTLTSGPR
jgi:eukaryotic-like serine/threonine-protein kinase